MRLLTIAYISSEQFLSHYSDKATNGAVFYRTRAELGRDEKVLMEISFPGLPNRALARGTVHDHTPGKGAWLAFSDSDLTTRDFLLQIARGELEITRRAERSADRFPATLTVDCKISSERLVARTADLGIGGVFVRSLTPPPVGTPVQITIGPSANVAFDEITLEGEVAWIRDADTDRGFGVAFKDKSKLDHRLLRTALRRASETGRVGFASS